MSVAKVKVIFLPPFSRCSAVVCIAGASFVYSNCALTACEHACNSISMHLADSASTYITYSTSPSKGNARCSNLFAPVRLQVTELRASREKKHGITKRSGKSSSGFITLNGKPASRMSLSESQRERMDEWMNAASAESCSMLNKNIINIIINLQECKSEELGWLCGACLVKGVLYLQIGCGTIEAREPCNAVCASRYTVCYCRRQ